MPKVKKSVARQNYPEQGIKKGDTYYSWSFFRQKPCRSKNPPRPSQLCNNKFSGALEAMEALEDAIAVATCPEDVTSAIDDAVSSLNDVAGEFDDAISNMEQAFPGGSPQIEAQTEQRDNINTCVQELEDVRSEIDNMDPDDYKDEEEDKDKTITKFEDLGTLGQQSFMDEVKEFANGVSLEG